MDSQQAKEILTLFRPDRPEPEDPEFAAAIEATRHDPELCDWFDAHCAIQRTLSARFNAITVPEGLKEQILSERKVRTTPFFSRRTAGFTLAVAALAALITVTALIIGPRENNDFAAFRHRMAGMVVRSYPDMDLETNNVDEIRKYLAQHQGHGNYVAPTGLQHLASTGCKLLTWHGRNVSMICFNSGTTAKPAQPDLFLFVVDSALVENAPPANSPQIARISTLATASWSDGEKTYVLGSFGNEESLRKYF